MNSLRIYSVICIVLCFFPLILESQDLPNEQEETEGITPSSEESSQSGVKDLPCKLPVPVSVIVYPENEKDQNIATEVLVGFRNGLKKIKDRVEYVDPTEDIIAIYEASEEPPEVGEAIESINKVIELLPKKDWKKIVQITEDALKIFEENLTSVKREILLQTILLNGIGYCGLKKVDKCKEMFQDLLVVRPSMEYDTTIYPESFAKIFNEVKEKVVNGPRGSIYITSVPSGAELYIDGKFVGATPYRIEGILVGYHYITLKLLGYHKIIQKVRVREDMEESIEVSLTRYNKTPAYIAAIKMAEKDVGKNKVGSELSSLGKNLSVKQIIMVKVAKVQGIVHIDAYLYDIETAVLLNNIKGEFVWEGRDLVKPEEMAVDIFNGVDPCGRIKVEEEKPPPPPPPPPPFYKRWWFWTAIGVGIIGIGVGSWAIYDATSKGGCPEGYYCLSF